MGRGRREDEELYFSRESRPQDTHRGNGLVFFDEEEAERQKRANRKPTEKIKITDRSAYERFMKRAMESAYESIEVRKTGIKEHREKERMLREGAGWVPPKVDANPDPSKLKAFDHSTDYYKVLGLDRAAAAKEITKVYKKKALELHPDKQRQDMPEEEKAKNQELFQEIVSAYEVLVDEPTRRAYDEFIDGEEVRGKTYGAPRKGPAPGPIYRGKRAQGLPTEVDFRMDLCSLWHGCVEPVKFTRRVFDVDNQCQEHEKTFYINVPAGSQPGKKFVYPNEGDESMQMSPGDVVFILRDTVPPHDVLQRRGDRVIYVEFFEHLNGKKMAVVGHCARELLAGGTEDNLAYTILKGLGMPPPPSRVASLIENPGDCYIEVEASALKRTPEQATAVVHSCLHLAPLYLVNSEMVHLSPAVLDDFRKHVKTWLPRHLQAREGRTANAHGSLGVLLRISHARGWSPRTNGDVGASTAVPESHMVSLPAAALMGNMSLSWPEASPLRWRVVVLEVGAYACGLLDDEMRDLWEADALILDAPDPVRLADTSPALLHLPADIREAWELPEMTAERAAAAVAEAFTRHGLWEMVWRRYWDGALVVGVGAGAAVLGRPGPWPQEGDEDEGTPEEEEEEEEEDEFGAMPKPEVVRPEWHAEWEKRAVLPLLVRGNIPDPSDGVGPDAANPNATIRDPWRMFGEMCGRVPEDLPNVVERPAGVDTSAIGLGLADGSVLAVWPTLKTEFMGEGKLLRTGDRRRAELGLILAALQGGIKGLVCIAMSGENKRHLRAEKKAAAEAAIRKEEERLRVESAMRAAREKRERAERLRQERNAAAAEAKKAAAAAT